MKIIHQIYCRIRSPILFFVKITNCLRLFKFFEKVDHWIRIRPYKVNIVAKRNGFMFNFDLSQLIDNQIYFEFAYEEQTCEAYQQIVCQDMCVIDIGANIGAHTFNFARLVGQGGQVYAIEPTDWAYRKLQENIMLNTAVRDIIATKNIALSDQSLGQKKYKFRAQWLKQGGHVEDENGVVEFLSLDDFKDIEELSRIDFIKLDVDGFETKILRGACDILANFRPVILVEMSDFFQKRAGDSGKELVGILKKYDYEFYDLEFNMFDIQLDEILANLKDWDTMNVICVPSEKVTNSTFIV